MVCLPHVDNDGDDTQWDGADNVSPSTQYSVTTQFSAAAAHTSACAGQPGPTALLIQTGIH